MGIPRLSWCDIYLVPPWRIQYQIVGMLESLASRNRISRLNISINLCYQTCHLRYFLVPFLQEMSILLPVFSLFVCIHTFVHYNVTLEKWNKHLSCTCAINFSSKWWNFIILMSQNLRLTSITSYPLDHWEWRLRYIVSTRPRWVNSSGSKQNGRQFPDDVIHL